MITLLWTAALFIAIFATGEFLLRKGYLPAEKTRLITHIASGLLAAYFYNCLDRKEIIILSAAFLLLLIISKRGSLFRGIHNVQRKTYGEFFFPLGVAFAAIVFLPESPAWYQLSLLTLALADPAANIFGVRFSKARILKKTLGGFVAFGLTAFVIALFFLNPLIALIYAFVTATVETVSELGSDNLTITVGAYIVHIFTV